jgi:hypothetical protein
VNNLMGERAVVRSVTLCRELRLLGLTIEGWDAKRSSRLTRLRGRRCLRFCHSAR